MFVFHRHVRSIAAWCSRLAQTEFEKITDLLRCRSEAASSTPAHFGTYKASQLRHRSVESLRGTEMRMHHVG